MKQCVVTMPGNSNLPRDKLDLVLAFLTQAARYTLCPTSLHLRPMYTCCLCLKQPERLLFSVLLPGHGFQDSRVEFGLRELDAQQGPKFSRMWSLSKDIPQSSLPQALYATVFLRTELLLHSDETGGRKRIEEIVIFLPLNVE